VKGPTVGVDESDRDDRSQNTNLTLMQTSYTENGVASSNSSKFHGPKPNRNVGAFNTESSYDGVTSINEC
jgi:hypothetical protein